MRMTAPPAAASSCAGMRAALDAFGVSAKESKPVRWERPPTTTRAAPADRWRPQCQRRQGCARIARVARERAAKEGAAAPLRPVACRPHPPGPCCVRAGQGQHARRRRATRHALHRRIDAVQQPLHDHLIAKLNSHALSLQALQRKDERLFNALLRHPHANPSAPGSARPSGAASRRFGSPVSLRTVKAVVIDA